MQSNKIAECRKEAEEGASLDTLLTKYDEVVVDLACSPGTTWDGERWYF